MQNDRIDETDRMVISIFLKNIKISTATAAAKHRKTPKLPDLLYAVFGQKACLVVLEDLPVVMSLAEQVHGFDDDQFVLTFELNFG